MQAATATPAAEAAPVVAPVPPASPAGQPGVATVQGPAPGTILRPLTSAEREAIGEARSQLSDQLISAANRRNNLAEQLAEVPPEARPGIIERMRVLDERIVQIETDIATTGRQLTQFTTQPLPPTPRVMGIPEEVFFPLTGILTLFVLAPIALAFARLMWKRATSLGRMPVRDPRDAERMERLEQAVDAIAIEIERVGESQRYQARLLHEAQIMPAMPALGAAQSPAEPIRQRTYEPLRARDEGA